MFAQITTHKQTSIISLHQLLQFLVKEHCHHDTQPSVDAINETFTDVKALGNQRDLHLHDTMTSRL